MQFADVACALKTQTAISDRTVLHSKMEGPCPDKFHFYAKESRLCKPCAEKPPIRANVQTVCRKCAAVFLHRKRALNLTIQRSFIGAPPGTRTLGPLIKRASPRFVSISGSFESSQFLIKSTLFFTQQFLHPLSDFATICTLCTV